MKIAMVAHNYLPNVGGLETAVHGLARSLATRHQVVLVTSAFGSARGIAREDGLEIHRLPVVRVLEHVGVPYPVPVGPGVRNAVRASRGADVVHVHGSLYIHSLLASQLARHHGVPLVLTEHVGAVPYASRALRILQSAAWRTVGKSVLSHVARATALNERVVDWLRQQGCRPDAAIIPNGIDGERFRPPIEAQRRAARARFGLPNGRTLALVVARDSPKKNVQHVVRACRSADCTLVVCGANSRSVSEGVIDLGVVPYAHMPDLLAAVDILIHAGVGEGFPVAVQEAMATSLPVALLWEDAYASAVSSAALLPVAGLENLGAAIEKLAADEPLRSRLGRMGFEEAGRRWSWRATADEYEQIYRDVMEKRTRLSRVDSSAHLS